MSEQETPQNEEETRQGRRPAETPPGESKQSASAAPPDEEEAGSVVEQFTTKNVRDVDLTDDFLGAKQDFITAKRDFLYDDDEEVLERAIERWKEFYIRMWGHGNIVLERDSRRFAWVGSILRILVIILSVSVTTLSGLEIRPQTVTIIAGILTVLTSIEGFLGLLDRRAQLQQMQREIQTLRDQLGFQWMVEVELERDTAKRLESAKRILHEGPIAYNEILNKYAFKSSEESSG